MNALQPVRDYETQSYEAGWILRYMNQPSKHLKGTMVQVLKLILPIIVGIFFVIFGIHLLINSYALTDPFSFVITFFASNLMILISVAISLGFAIKLNRHFRTPSKKK